MIGEHETQLMFFLFLGGVFGMMSQLLYWYLREKKNFKVLYAFPLSIVLVLGIVTLAHFCCGIPEEKHMYIILIMITSLFFFVITMIENRDWHKAHKIHIIPILPPENSPPK